MKKLVFLSGKYSTGDTKENILEARKAAIKLWEAGYAVFCPHLNTAGFENDCKCTYDDYIEGDLAILNRCDMIIMLPGWLDSPGAKIERRYAFDNGIPIKYFTDLDL